MDDLLVESFALTREVARRTLGLRPFDVQVMAGEARTNETLARLRASGEDGAADPALRGPSATWTYLVNDRALTELQQMLFGRGSVAFSAGAALMTWPLLLGWALWRRIRGRRG